MPQCSSDKVNLRRCGYLKFIHGSFSNNNDNNDTFQYASKTKKKYTKVLLVITPDL